MYLTSLKDGGDLTVSIPQFRFNTSIGEWTKRIWAKYYVTAPYGIDIDAVFPYFWRGLLEALGYFRKWGNTENRIPLDIPDYIKNSYMYEEDISRAKWRAFQSLIEAGLFSDHKIWSHSEPVKKKFFPKDESYGYPISIKHIRYENVKLHFEETIQYIHEEINKFVHKISDMETSIVAFPGRINIWDKGIVVYDPVSVLLSPSEALKEKYGDHVALVLSSADS